MSPWVHNNNVIFAAPQGDASMMHQGVEHAAQGQRATQRSEGRRTYLDPTTTVAQHFMTDRVNSHRCDQGQMIIALPEITTRAADLPHQICRRLHPMSPISKLSRSDAEIFRHCAESNPMSAFESESTDARLRLMRSAAVFREFFRAGGCRFESTLGSHR